MVLPRGGLATKGIVPFDLIKYDLIKSFSLSDWIKDFPDENILNAKVTSSADFFIVEMKYYIPTSTLTTYFDLGNGRQSDGIHGNPRKNGFP